MNQTETEKETRAEPRQTPKFTSVRFDDVDAEKAYAAASRLTSEIEKVIVGKHREVLLLITAMLAGGHVLIEDVPGVGKHDPRRGSREGRRARFPPRAVHAGRHGVGYNRLQHIQPQGGELRVHSGTRHDQYTGCGRDKPCVPKTHSALLEAMEEGRVTVDGKTYILPDPFMVIATQNPSGFVGTYPLPGGSARPFQHEAVDGLPDAGRGDAHRRGAHRR